MQGTALQIAKQTAMELGLPVPTELVTSLEATSVQLLALLNAVGNELVMLYEWEFLLKTETILTVANQQSYPKPSDFSRMVNQTIWDGSNRRPAYGPVSPQGWQTLNNALISVGPFSRYRVAGSKFDFLPIPGSDGLNFNYQYISDGWVNSYLDPNEFLPLVSNDSDLILFDFWLTVKFLKLKMWQAKGLDTAALVNDFTRALEQFTGADHGAPILGLANTYQTPWLNTTNVPDGNWNTGTP